MSPAPISLFQSRAEAESHAAQQGGVITRELLSGGWVVHGITPEGIEAFPPVTSYRYECDCGWRSDTTPPRLHEHEGHAITALPIRETQP